MKLDEEMNRRAFGAEHLVDQNHYGDANKKVCQMCGGAKKIPLPQRIISPGIADLVLRYTDCPACHGTGKATKVVDHQKPSPALENTSETRLKTGESSTCLTIQEIVEWQPIETAPKDGTEILGWRLDCGVLLIRYISPIEFLTDNELSDLDEESAETADWFYADFVKGGRLDGDDAPTHWRPLPTPPAPATDDDPVLSLCDKYEKEMQIMNRGYMIDDIRSAYLASKGGGR